MTEYTTKRNVARPPMHPGELLREDVIPALGRPKAEIARMLGISRGMLYGILDEKKSITPAMALRIGKLCGNGPDIWLRLQASYDLAIAQKQIGRELEKIKTLKSAA